MLQRRTLQLLTLALCLVPQARAADASKPVELLDGDRVVFLGDTLIEREQYHGYIELAMTTRFPERHVTFRNLGWSADTPGGDSRFGLSLLQAGHEPADEGWKQLREQLRQARPTVVVLGYGMASSFAGEAGLPKFRADIARLLDAIQEDMGKDKVRFVILSPIPHLPGPKPLAPPDLHNQELAQYARALQEIATQRQAVFISLFNGLKAEGAKGTLSDNGIHLNAEGYKHAARIIERGLGWPPGVWDQPQAAKLREVILRKNEWFFHRSRPANMAYIFGFRKREQGQNAVEMPQFDKLIEAEEQNIALLRPLKNVELPAAPAPRTRAAAAKFTPQPRPSFDVAPGLEVTLWAENPALHKPIQMNFDPQGRLWVASSEVYPQIEPGQTANDKILILEDTDGDGKADKSTVFADGLLIPTGLEPGDGGVYVAQSTELLHFKDTDGDGKADQRRVVLSGFGTEDTHHNLHTLRWGHDGRLYMNQSVYTRTDTETPHGVVRLKSGGVLRLQPRSMQCDVFLRGFWNSWGHQFDAFGQSFLTDGAGGTGINYGLPGATYEAYARAPRVLKGISPGSYPKFCSLEIVCSRHFPDDWQGDMITCDFRANRVVRFRVHDEGAGYVAVEHSDVLRSKEVAFRPIDVKLGPDGALYIADWSNPIIQHGEVDFRDPRRDHEHGRIWRVTCKDRPAEKRITRWSTVTALDLLRSLNSFDRAQARRVLVERGEKILPELDAWVAKQTKDRDLLEGLWLKQALGVPDTALLERLLGAADSRVRAAAVRVGGDWVSQPPAFSDLGLIILLQDSHPRVRLEAVRALASLDNGAAADIALNVLDNPMDRFLDHALWLTFSELADPWLADLASGHIKTDGREKALTFALGAVPPEKAGPALAKLLRTHPIPRDGRGPWIELIGQAGGASELAQLFELAAAGKLDEPAAVRALAALASAARLRRTQPGANQEQLTRLLDSDQPKLREAAVRLAGAWRTPSLTPKLRELVSDKSATTALRMAACLALQESRTPAALAKLRELTRDDKAPAALRRQALLGLASVEADAVLPQLLAELRNLDGPEAEEFWRSLLGFAGMMQKLKVSVQRTPLPRSAAAAGLRVARENDERSRELIKVLAQQAGVPEPTVYANSELQKLAVQARLHGDAARGELVYRRADTRCLVCHAIGGAGGKVGPDMTSIGAAAPLDYLVESTLLPNRKIKENYHSTLISTVDGKVLTGVPVRETAQEVVLRDANDKEIAVPHNAIDERASAGSLMPSGLLDPLSDQDRLDLFRFLGELGKPGPFDATKSRGPRQWQILLSLPRPGEERTQAERGEGPGWTPLTTTVGGNLLKSEVRALATGGQPTTTILAATHFTTPTAGPVQFETPHSGKLSAWLDGKPITLEKQSRFEVAAGPHVLVVQLTLADMPDQFVVRSENVVFVAK